MRSIDQLYRSRTTGRRRSPDGLLDSLHTKALTEIRYTCPPTTFRPGVALLLWPMHPFALDPSSFGVPYWPERAREERSGPVASEFPHPWAAQLTLFLRLPTRCAVQFWRTNIADRNGDTLAAAKEKLKERLLDIVRSTERGISTSEEQRQDIDELIAALEPCESAITDIISASPASL